MCEGIAQGRSKNTPCARRQRFSLTVPKLNYTKPNIIIIPTAQLIAQVFGGGGGNKNTTLTLNLYEESERESGKDVKKCLNAPFAIDMNENEEVELLEVLFEENIPNCEMSQNKVYYWELR